MVDTSDVADLDPFELLDIESERVAKFFENLDDEGWTKDTRCEGWRVRELLSHLDGVEVYHRACLDDKISQLFEEAKKAGSTGFNDFNDWIVSERADKAAEEVISSWRAANEDVRKRLRERGRDGTLSSSVGPYPVGLMAFHIASEYATHGDDMNVPVDDGEKAGRTAWREKVSLFALKETEKPVELEKVDGGYNVRAEGEEAKLSAEEFVEAATARLKTISAKLQDALRALA
jgi:uncharacterized protein (TIGR03083 family)